MCTRQKAIQFVITNGAGTEKQLVSVISKRQYDEFMAVGLIKKPLRIMTRHSSQIEWVATSLAFERAHELNLKAVRSLKFRRESKRKKRGLMAFLSIGNEVD